MTAEPQHKWTVDEYLAFEEESEIRHELYDGEIFAMSGASPRHNQISWNVVGALAPQIRRGPCRGFAADMRVKIPTTGLYTYPDAGVICGDPQYTDEQPRSLLNPTMIVEILSATSQDFDRGRKFAHYRTIPSLQIYLVVDQGAVHVERYTRQPDGQWILYETDDVTETVELPAIGASLALSDVYERVDDL
jgi:Uma2 family endonuclease